MSGSVWQLHGIVDLRSFCRVALPLQGYVVCLYGSRGLMTMSALSLRVKRLGRWRRGGEEGGLAASLEEHSHFYSYAIDLNLPI